MRWGLLSVAAALAAAPVARAEPCRFILSRAAMAGGCAVPRPAPILAEVPVRPWANPTSAPIRLRIDFVPPSAPAIHLASVSLYPADQAQTFAVRLPPKIGRLTVSEIPGPRPVTVEVGPVVWRYVEP